MVHRQMARQGQSIRVQVDGQGAGQRQSHKVQGDGLEARQIGEVAREGDRGAEQMAEDALEGGRM